MIVCAHEMKNMLISFALNTSGTAPPYATVATASRLDAARLLHLQTRRTVQHPCFSVGRQLTIVIFVCVEDDFVEQLGDAPSFLIVGIADEVLTRDVGQAVVNGTIDMIAVPRKEGRTSCRGQNERELNRNMLTVGTPNRRPISVSEVFDWSITVAFSNDTRGQRRGVRRYGCRASKHNVNSVPDGAGTPLRRYSP